ncbi:unnamed protein product [Pleuronectes platessa]|uniref:Uncharacterized protein n=1 Tax=Pleuronectes platessa TaxID=8262 RepID=A0A9N7UWW2_PLEPL|nr:unnamed protein product [Pleuronectes platessa]
MSLYDGVCHRGLRACTGARTRKGGRQRRSSASSPVVLPPRRRSAFAALLRSLPPFLSRFRAQRLASPHLASSSSSSSLSPHISLPLPSRMPQPRTPGQASRQMVAPSAATPDTGHSGKAHGSVAL